MLCVLTHVGPLVVWLDPCKRWQLKLKLCVPGDAIIFVYGPKVVHEEPAGTLDAFVFIANLDLGIRISGGFALSIGHTGINLDTYGNNITYRAL